MNPTDSSVTSVGSQTLSSLDISKLQCLYNCDGRCGGHVTGDLGTLQSQADNSCKWLLAVSDGHAIEISFESFDVSYLAAAHTNVIPYCNSCQIDDCSTGHVKVYDGADDTATLKGTFCGNTAPSIFTSSDKNLYVVYTNTDTSSAGFKASWKKVTSKHKAKLDIPECSVISSHLLLHSERDVRQLRCCLFLFILPSW